MGYIPFAPGTFGTLAGIPLYLAVCRLPLWAYLVVTAAAICLAVAAADRAEKIFGGHDDKKIVIDEVVGYMVTMVGIAPSFSSMALGFILFRFFDILKPWPCRAIDKSWPRGFGVVMDDVAAGVYAAAVLQIIIYFWPVLGRSTW